MGKEMLALKVMMTAIASSMVLAGCAYFQALPPEQLLIEKVVDAPNVSKELIVEKSKVWFAKSFRQSMAGWWEQNSTRTVIQYENRENGMLIANGAILYPLEHLYDSYKNGWEVRFTLQEEIKEGKVKVSFSNLNLFVPTTICGNSYAGSQSTGSYEKRLNTEEYEKVKPVFNGYIDQLGAYLAAPQKEW